jgi:hypothetical protein
MHALSSTANGVALSDRDLSVMRWCFHGWAADKNDLSANASSHAGIRVRLRLRFCIRVSPADEGSVPAVLQEWSVGRVVAHSFDEPRIRIVSIEAERGSLQERLDEAGVRDGNRLIGGEWFAPGPSSLNRLENLCRMISPFGNVACSLVNYQKSDFVHGRENQIHRTAPLGENKTLFR